MIRLFNVYYPVRTLVLLLGEALVVFLSFVLGRVCTLDLLQLNNALFIEGKFAGLVGGWPGLANIFLLTAVVLLLSHGFDLYDSERISAHVDQALRLLVVVSLVAVIMAALLRFFPRFSPGQNAAVAGFIILVVCLFGWRSVYAWLLRQAFFREPVYVLGTGERAERVVNGLKARSELGIEVVGWTGNIEGELTLESVANNLRQCAKNHAVHRVIVAMPDRRGTLPVEELLELRKAGVRVEEATSWLEKISGYIEVDQLYPSWLIFADGFRFSPFFRMVRRVLNFLVALVGCILAAPLLPFIILLIKLDSPGPIFYRQIRVGRGGKTFYCYKFRTMREDAEADTGPTWALDDDPRITRGGRFLRRSRLDEIPQLVCVLLGDMHFVGPRPERPEFVEKLKKEIRYYEVRHMVRPGITGWAQVQYKYGNTLEDAREKLQYDLYYIKNASIGLDLMIWFQTIKIVVRGRGAK